MTKPGPKPKPVRQAEREGNPGKRAPKTGAKLAPHAPPEPDWRDWFQVTNGDHADDNGKCRAVASRTWQLIVPVLDAQGLLAQVDELVLADLCVCAARVHQCERDISRHGLWVDGERGAQKNPAVTAANQYRIQLKFYVAELGLSPSSRTGLPETEGVAGDDSPYDV